MSYCFTGTLLFCCDIFVSRKWYWLYFLFKAALSTAALQLSTVIDGGGPPRDDMRIPGGAVDSIPKQTVRSAFSFGNSGRLRLNLYHDITMGRKLIFYTHTEIKKYFIQ